MTRNEGLPRINKSTSAQEYWKQEKCECYLCKHTGGYLYDIPDTHRETSDVTHGFFEIMDFEGVSPS